MNKLGISGMGFSNYEKRAIFVLIAFLLIGSGVRIYKHKVLSTKIEIWVEDDSKEEGVNLEDSVQTENSENYSRLQIDLNKAELEDLCTLPGIGTVKARAIINFRNKNGNFGNIDELAEVYGIGSSMVDNFRDFVLIDSVCDTFSGRKK
ncbi:MAG: helix-hairpin-helix domain-containing protein [Calditrichaeota bacterium]|nr:helix-hairpin-helix domain-containing protein [Calditrichota bacterium]MBT7788886.1 helix-hairpin-helix domain-containing protein [Calditrichota bacterium]